MRSSPTNQVVRLAWVGSHRGRRLCRAFGVVLSRPPMQLRSLVVLWLVSVAGCDRSSLQPVSGHLELSAQSLHFENTLVGASSTHSLVLRNTSRASRTIFLVTEPPFSASAEVVLSGAAERAVEMQFNPSREGKVAGSLLLTDDLASYEVLLDGQGVTGAECIPSALCLNSVFDPATAVCLESAATDGSSCGNTCLEGGSCLSGICRGTSRDCGDGNRCTVDACDPVDGCRHLPIECAAPANPCKVAHCDPQRGCVESDAEDGASCGPADCVTARVCLLGTCKSVSVPDGASCGVATPCQDKGTCKSHQCELPPVRALTEVWSRPLLGDGAGFHGISDAQQNLYWTECGTAWGQLMDPLPSCFAVSFTRNGTKRFSTLVGSPFADASENLLSGNHFVYALGTQVGSVSASSGAPEWTFNLETMTLPAVPDVADRFQIRALAAAASGSVYVTVGRSLRSAGADLSRKAALLQLDPNTGAVVLARYFDGQLNGLVLDEYDNLFLGLSELTGAAERLIALAPTGNERFRVAASTPLAAFGGEVVLTSGEVRSSMDGAVRATSAMWLHDSVLMSSAARIVVHAPPSGGLCTCDDAGMNCECPPPQPNPEIDAFAVAPGSAQSTWAALVSFGNAAVSHTVATDLGDTLVLGGFWTGDQRLIALTASGHRRFDCSVPPFSPGREDTVIGPVALLEGRWGLMERTQCASCPSLTGSRLRVFEVPGERRATKGWAGAVGGPSGGSRPVH
jgi:hypothetical protein